MFSVRLHFYYQQIQLFKLFNRQDNKQVKN